MRVFQINDEILVSHDGETAKINWSGASIPATWQAKVCKGVEELVNTIVWENPPVSLSKTQTTHQGKRLFVNAMMSGSTPAIYIALDFVPDDYQYSVEFCFV